MNTQISDMGIKLLKKMVGKTITSITADDWQSYNRSYGNIRIDLEDSSIEIDNDYRYVPYFDSMEELAGYDVLSLDHKNFEPHVIADDLHSEKLNMEIMGINIYRDIITLGYENKEETYLIDQAIMFKFKNMDWLVSQTSIFTPISKMVFGNDLADEIKSIEEVKEDWEDDDLGFGENSPRYKVSVKREVLDL